MLLRNEHACYSVTLNIATHTHTQTSTRTALSLSTSLASESGQLVGSTHALGPEKCSIELSDAYCLLLLVSKGRVEDIV